MILQDKKTNLDIWLRGALIDQMKNQSNISESNKVSKN